MCVFSRPKPPPAPEPEPVDSPIEETADEVVVAKRKKKEQQKTMATGRRTGTRSLQIPLQEGASGGNLRYPS
jgi:hypothetical protein|tara:strand:+ start:441 stop:656 length:216 start_codon:yes stop_codon:yes gene_type:complete